MKKQKSVTRSILACIRLLAALIVLTAGFRSVGRGHELPREAMGDTCQPSNLAGVACVDIIEALDGYVCLGANPCITCMTWAVTNCRYEENYLPGKVKLEPNTT